MHRHAPHRHQNAATVKGRTTHRGSGNIPRAVRPGPAKPGGHATHAMPQSGAGPLPPEHLETAVHRLKAGGRKSGHEFVRQPPCRPPAAKKEPRSHTPGFGGVPRARRPQAEKSSKGQVFTGWHGCSAEADSRSPFAKFSNYRNSGRKIICLSPAPCLRERAPSSHSSLLCGPTALSLLDDKSEIGRRSRN